MKITRRVERWSPVVVIVAVLLVWQGVVAGFGIKDAASAAEMARSADGVVVGSALVAALAEASNPVDAAARAKAFLTPLRAALDAG